MDKIKLLKYGYFFKELPPVFNSVELGDKFTSIVMPDFGITSCIDFSIPKGQYSRRILELSHPINYIHIVEHLTKPANWSILTTHFAKTNFSNSRVVENDKAGTNKIIANKDNRATTTSYEDFKTNEKKILNGSYDKLYELKVDITKFYQSIYTHTFTWAILGKEIAKKIYKKPKNQRILETNFNLYDFADKLDILIRSCQEKQSIGIPTGSDTSHIISEIIACYIDEQLKNKFPNIEVFRYFDDYSIYTDKAEDVQIVLKYLQQILGDLQLSINESKLKISKFPFAFEESWVKQINDVRITIVDEAHIKQYFNTVFDMSSKYPDKSSAIFKYALKTFEVRVTEINRTNWELFEALLLKSILIEPSILEIASRIFETYKTFVAKERVKKVVLKVIENHCVLKHHYEIVWALWICKQLGISLTRDLAQQIIDVNNNFSTLLLLDLNSKNLVENQLSKEMIKSIKELIFLDESKNWLLYYEAVKIKRWFVAENKDVGLSKLQDAGISFYNVNAIIKIYDKPKKLLEL